MDADARPRRRLRPGPWAAAGADPVPRPVTGGGDDVDDPVPFSDDELADDWPDIGEPLTADEFPDLPDRPPWWIVTGERIEATALANRTRKRERERREGFFPLYDTFWGYVDVDPVSVLPTVRAATVARDWRNFELQRFGVPRPLALRVGVVVAAAAALVMVDGSVSLRLVAFATCLLFGVWFAVTAPTFAISSRSAALGAGATAMACVVVSTIPAIQATRWYAVLMGVAFAAVGLFVAAMWPIMMAWRVERIHWGHPDVAMVAALLEFSDDVGSGPEARRHAVAALDRAATQFELSWHRVHRTGVDVTDRQLRGWAARIRAETRELQRACAFDRPSTFAVLMRTYKLILAIVNRDSLEEREDSWVRHGSWRRPPTSALARVWARSKQSGRYVRQCLLAGFLAIAASLLLADTVWSAVPAFIGTHVSRELGSALNFDPTVRVFVATISLSLFAVAGRAFSRRH